MQPKPHFCSFFLNDCDEIIHCIHLITAVSHLISSDLAPSVVCIFHSWTSLLHELYSSSLTAFALCCAWENKMLSVFQEWKQTLKKKKIGKFWRIFGCFRITAMDLFENRKVCWSSDLITTHHHSYNTSVTHTHTETKWAVMTYRLELTSLKLTTINNYLLLFFPWCLKMRVLNL